MPSLPQLGVRLHDHLPPPCWDFIGLDFHRSCTRCHKSCPLYVLLLWCARTTLISCSHLPPMVPITFLLPSSGMMPEPWKEGVWSKCPSRTETSYSLHGVSMLSINIGYEGKLWGGLRDTLSCEHTESLGVSLTLCPLNRTTVVGSPVRPRTCLAIGSWSLNSGKAEFLLTDSLKSSQKTVGHSDNLHTTIVSVGTSC